ncbi:MAG: hypothetical protein R3C11_13605 [Planctomycetaceae bacterium]
MLNLPRLLTLSLILLTSITTAAEPLHLPFWDQNDILTPAGSEIEIKANYLEYDTPATNFPRSQYGCEVPRDENTFWVYGWRMQNIADKPNRTIEVVRAWTPDGLNFNEEEIVFSLKDGDWQGFANLVYRPTDGSLFLFSYSAGHLRVFRTDNGTTWEKLTDEAYTNHDAMHITWYPPWNEFLNYQNTLEPYPTRYPDNIGELRRVFSFLRSKDGVEWTSYAPEFLQGEKLWKPDDLDPVDLEFYRSIVIPTEGRYALLIQRYIAPPPEANSRRATTKHGPRSSVEIAISYDGLNWERPHRKHDVTLKVGSLPVQGPSIHQGKIRFYQPEGDVYAFDEGRLFYATCLGNGEFSTRLFTMPMQGLTLNVDASWPANQGETGRAYVMVEALDAEGNLIPGYERTNFLLENIDNPALPLNWTDHPCQNLAGQQIQLRFYFCEAKIYSISENK